MHATAGLVHDFGVLDERMVEIEVKERPMLDFTPNTGFEEMDISLKEFLPKVRGVIVGEPTLLRPVVAHNGVIRWRTITRGRAAHSSDPSKGVSAISAMLRVVETLESKYVPSVTRTHPMTGRAAASVNTIRGGTAVNIIPAVCEIECDRRTVPGETAEQILRESGLKVGDLATKENFEAIQQAVQRGRGIVNSMLGYARDELLGRSIADLVEPERVTVEPGGALEIGDGYRDEVDPLDDQAISPLGLLLAALAPTAIEPTLSGMMSTICTPVAVEAFTRFE